MIRAAFVRAPFQVEIREVAPVRPGHHEVLLDVDCVGICGSDVHLAAAWAEDWRRFGHETAARVVEVGRGVEDLAPGDLVAVRTTTMCGICRSCMDGAPRACLNWRDSRMSFGFAEQMVAPRTALWKVANLDTEAATLIEPLAVALNLVETAAVGLGHFVVIVGPGPIGIMAIRIARLRGARHVLVVGTARDAHRRGLCEELGADEFVTIEDTDVDQLVGDRTAGVGADRIIVTAPPAAVAQSLRLGRYGAIVTFIGFAAKDADAVVPIDLNAFHFSKLQLRAAYAAPSSPFPHANRLLADGTVPAAELITHRFAFDDLGRALRTVGEQRDGVVKAVVRIGATTR